MRQFLNRTRILHLRLLRARESSHAGPAIPSYLGVDPGSSRNKEREM
jgi:hypothetical protein